MFTIADANQYVVYYKSEASFILPVYFFSMQLDLYWVKLVSRSFYIGVLARKRRLAWLKHVPNASVDMHYI